MARLVHDLEAERRALASTLAELGPDAPTASGSWTTADLAVHVVLGELLWAVPNAPFRWLVGRGVRLDWMAPLNERAHAFQRRRHDLDWALRRLERRAPWLHRRGRIAAVSLLECWAHHEDVLLANDGSCRSRVNLAPALEVLVRYHRPLLDDQSVRVTSMGEVWHVPRATPLVTVDGPMDDTARWLSGRASVTSLDVAGDPDSAALLASQSFRI